jgi:hypothetical protein
MNTTPLIYVNPTNNELVFKNDPATRWTWKYYFEIFSADFSSDISGNIRVAISSATFRSDIQPNDIVWIGTIGQVRVISKDSSSILVDFPAVGFTPPFETEIRLLPVEQVAVTVNSTVTPFRVAPDLEGIFTISPYALIRRAFTYAAVTAVTVTYKMSLSATVYTALRAANNDPQTIWGVWPYVAYWQPASIASQPLKLPVQNGTTAVNPQAITLPPTALQTFLMQPGTPWVITMTGQTLSVEPNKIPAWMQIQQVGGNIVLTGTAPNVPGDYSFELDLEPTGGSSFLVDFTVLEGIYEIPFCADRIGFTWLGQNGRWKTYYFAEDYTRNFSETNGGVVRLGGVQRFVGMDELRQGVTVAERYLTNPTMAMLFDFMLSPVFYSLPDLRPYYLNPSPKAWRKLPYESKNNSVEFGMIEGNKTPTIYEG